MKQVLLIPSLLLIAAGNLLGQEIPPQQEGSIFSLEVGNLLFRVDSSFGAKISSLTIDGEEFLVTADMVGSDYLWGATLWPSPQSEWGWNNPNKYIWDNQEYTAAIDVDTMRFTGKEAEVDNGDSFYFIKNFWANAKDTSLVLRYSMVNTTGKTIKKALWELTRVPVGGLTFWPTGPGGTWGELAFATEVAMGHTWYERDGQDGTNLKFFADGKDGWFAHVDDVGRLLIKTFEDVDQADFASGEGEIELWVAGEYIELENQSLCTNIADQEKLDYDVKWYLRQLPEYIRAEPGNQELIDYVLGIISKTEIPPVSRHQGYVKSLRLYPNPAKNTLYMSVDGTAAKTFSYMLFNTSGQLVKQGRRSSGSIDVSELKSGLFFIQMKSGNDIFSKKIVIE